MDRPNGDESDKDYVNRIIKSWMEKKLDAPIRIVMRFQHCERKEKKEMGLLTLELLYDSFSHICPDRILCDHPGDDFIEDVWRCTCGDGQVLGM